MRVTVKEVIMKGVFNRILVAWVILLNLFISSTSFGQSPDEARMELEKRKVPWSDEEFMARTKRGDSDVLELFLAAGMKPDTKDSEGRTALIWAAVNGHAAAVKVLLNTGADVNAIDNIGMTSLMGAASGGKSDVVRTLLEKDANVNSSSRDGMTALMLASSEGHKEIINILIDRGATINAINRDGRTALILAASNGHAEVVKALLEKGVDIDIRDNGGLTALMWAETNKRTAVAGLLRKVTKEEIYSVPSQTLTNPQLQRDVWNYILQLELASDEKCHDHGIISTEITEYPSRIGVNKWAESWLVDRCGQRIFYRIEFRPDERGGAYLKVLEERDQASEESGPRRY